MDKSFNDQELSDIMKEIEALEGDFESSSEARSEQADKEEKPDAGHEEAETEVMGQLSQMSEDSSVQKTNHSESQTLPFSRSHSSDATGSTSMSLKVQGNLTLDLFFEVGGKTIGLEVSENGLTIKMDGGMSFNVPIHSDKDYKKAS